MVVVSEVEELKLQLSYPSPQTCVLGTQKHHFIESTLLSTHNICLHFALTTVKRKKMEEKKTVSIRSYFTPSNPHSQIHTP